MKTLLYAMLLTPSLVLGVESLYPSTTRGITEGEAPKAVAGFWHSPEDGAELYLTCVSANVDMEKQELVISAKLHNLSDTPAEVDPAYLSAAGYDLEDVTHSNPNMAGKSPIEFAKPEKDAIGVPVVLKPYEFREIKLVYGIKKAMAGYYHIRCCAATKSLVRSASIGFEVPAHIGFSEDEAREFLIDPPMSPHAPTLKDGKQDPGDSAKDPARESGLEFRGITAKVDVGNKRLVVKGMLHNTTDKTIEWPINWRDGQGITLAEVAPVSSEGRISVEHGIRKEVYGSDKGTRFAPHEYKEFTVSFSIYKAKAGAYSASLRVPSLFGEIRGAAFFFCVPEDVAW